MTKTNPDISLAQIRAIMEMIARDNGCCITQVEIRQVQSVLGKGSNGTIGAFVKQVKDEFFGARNYDRTNISSHLKSALIGEIDRYVDNAKECVNERLESTSRDNEELSRLNDEMHEKICELEIELKASKDDGASQLCEISNSLAKSEQKNDSLLDIETRKDAENEILRKDLGLANNEIKDLAKSIGALEANITSLRDKVADLDVKQRTTTEELSKAEREHMLAEQNTVHLQQSFEFLSQQKLALEQEIAELKSRENSLAAMNKQLQEKLELANNERIRDLLQTTLSEPEASKKTLKERKKSTANKASEQTSA